MVRNWQATYLSEATGRYQSLQSTHGRSRFDQHAHLTLSHKRTITEILHENHFPSHWSAHSQKMAFISSSLLSTSTPQKGHSFSTRVPNRNRWSASKKWYAETSNATWPTLNKIFIESKSHGGKSGLLDLRSTEVPRSPEKSREVPRSTEKSWNVSQSRERDSACLLCSKVNDRGFQFRDDHRLENWRRWLF